MMLAKRNHRLPDLMEEITPLFSRNFETEKLASNIQELENAYRIEFLVPGFTKEEIKVDFSKGYVTVQANHKEEQKNELYSVKEFTNTSLKRSIYVGENVDINTITASLKDGILTMDIPKKEIEVKWIDLK